MRRLIVVAWLVALAAGLPRVHAAAQAPAPHESPAEAAARVHREGGYPDRLVVADDDRDGSTREDDEGAGHGPTGRIGLHGDRDGGAPTTQAELPDWLRDLFDALGGLLGVAGAPIGYALLALGIALVIALVVFLIVRMRLPAPELRAERRRDASTTADPALDPLLAGATDSPEALAAQGRYREAIHALFLRALAAATRTGDVDRRGRTAREVVGLVGALHGALPSLDLLLALTELVWFGGRDATEAQYLEARAIEAEVQTRTAAAAGAPA